MRTSLYLMPMLVAWTLPFGCVRSTDLAEPDANVVANSGSRANPEAKVAVETVPTKKMVGTAAEVDSQESVSSHNPAANGPEDISFEDLNLGMQPDIVFRPWMVNERTKGLLEKRIRITGYMDPGVQQTSGFEEFILLKNTNCKFGPGGQADHLVWVKFKDGVSASFTDKVVQVEGVLELRPYPGPDGNTWSIYDLQADSFTTRPKWNR